MMCSNYLPLYQPEPEEDRSFTSNRSPVEQTTETMAFPPRLSGTETTCLCPLQDPPLPLTDSDSPRPALGLGVGHSDLHHPRTCPWQIDQQLVLFFHNPPKWQNQWSRHFSNQCDTGFALIANFLYFCQLRSAYILGKGGGSAITESIRCTGY